MISPLPYSILCNVGSHTQLDSNGEVIGNGKIREIEIYLFSLFSLNGFYFINECYHIKECYVIVHDFHLSKYNMK